MPAFSAQSEAVVEEGRAVANGHGEAGHRRTDGFAGVEGGVVQIGVVADELAPGHFALGRHRPVVQQGRGDRCASIPSITLRVAKAIRSWAGVMMPAWWTPWKGSGEPDER